jgi:hypothetical protein
MALPLIAAGIAARAVGKKLASRVAGGITGKGAKQVNPVYRNMQTGSVKIKPAQSTDPKINQGLAKMQQDAANKMVANRKSGGEANLYSAIAGAGKAIDKSMGMKTRVIKIKSGK